MLATATGLSRRDAAVQVSAAQKLAELPEVQQAVEEGRVSMINARAIARACDKAGTKAVGSDDGLLQKAAGLSVEQFAREANRWAAARCSDDGEAAYRRQRARRHLSIFDGDDGMVLIRGELDPVCAAKIRKRLRRCDINKPDNEQRSLPKRLADSMESLTGAGRGDNAASAATGGGKTSADITIVQHLTAEGDRAFAEIAGGDAIPQSVLEEHMCNAHYRGAVFSSQGVPLWQGQRRQLLDQSDRIKRFVSVHQPTTLN